MGLGREATNDSLLGWEVELMEPLCRPMPSEFWSVCEEMGHRLAHSKPTMVLFYIHSANVL